MSDNKAELLAFALQALRNGISLVPIDKNTKRPYTSLLPTGSDGKRTWKPFQEKAPTEKDVRRWIQVGAQIAFVGGAVSGGLECIDHDEVQGQTQRDAWVNLCDGMLDTIPEQQTGGGGYQFIYRYETPDERDGNLKLAFCPDDTEETGRAISIETRGEGGYFIVAPSIHPSGKRYVSISGDLACPPVIKKGHRDFLIAQAQKLDKAPKTRQQIRDEARSLPAKETLYRGSLNGQASVIDAYNNTVRIEDVLRDHGYTETNWDRFIRPGGEVGASLLKETDHSITAEMTHSTIDTGTLPLTSSSNTRMADR